MKLMSRGSVDRQLISAHTGQHKVLYTHTKTHTDKHTHTHKTLYTHAPAPFLASNTATSPSSQETKKCVGSCGDHNTDSTSALSCHLAGCVSGERTSTCVRAYVCELCACVRVRACMSHLFHNMHLCDVQHTHAWQARGKHTST